VAFLAGCTPLGGKHAEPVNIRSASKSSLAINSNRIKDSAQARMEGYIPNVELTNENNQKVLFYDDLLRGKVVLINFIYTACSGICPLSTANLIQVQKGFGNHLGRDVFMYSITLDPKTDAPEVLKRYATAFGAKSGWSFLTGDFNDIECCAIASVSSTRTRSWTLIRPNIVDSSSTATRPRASGRRGRACGSHRRLSDLFCVCCNSPAGQ